jgi:hypothetical protein
MGMAYEYEAWDREDAFLAQLNSGDAIRMHGMGVTEPELNEMVNPQVQDALGNARKQLK